MPARPNPNCTESYYVARPQLSAEGGGALANVIIVSSESSIPNAECGWCVVRSVPFRAVLGAVGSAPSSVSVGAVPRDVN